MTKNQRWGLIFFIILIIASILVTTEPWKRLNRGPLNEATTSEQIGPLLADQLLLQMHPSRKLLIGWSRELNQATGFNVVY